MCRSNSLLSTQIPTLFPFKRCLFTTVDGFAPSLNPESDHVDLLMDRQPFQLLLGKQLDTHRVSIRPTASVRQCRSHMDVIFTPPPMMQTYVKYFHEIHVMMVILTISTCIML